MRRRGRLADLRAGAFDGPAPGSRRLIDGLRSVAYVDFDSLPRYVELLRGNLRQSRFNPGAELHFAGENSHAAVLLNGDPRVKLSGVGFALGTFGGLTV